MPFLHHGMHQHNFFSSLLFSYKKKGELFQMKFFPVLLRPLKNQGFNILKISVRFLHC